jgi:hypothetical protein
LLTGFYVLIPTMACYQAFEEWAGRWQKSELQNMDAGKKLLVWLIAIPGLVLSPLLITLEAVAVGMTASFAGSGGEVWRQAIKEARKRQGEGRISGAVEREVEEILRKHGF